MRASIVISTYNRRQTLSETLASLRQLRYRDFEVVVVDGPSTDDTADLLEEWKEAVKIARCPVANLAVSRNIGIAAAAGDIVAFIDDDAIPDPQWLDNLVAGYDSDEVGAVGSLVYDNTGYEFQTKYIVCDRFGNAVNDIGFNPTQLYNFPRAPRYASHLGTNTSFRRSLLIEIGGFDEEFAYYLDETDLCLRVVDSGHVVKYVDDAFVYHKFATSDVRHNLPGRAILVRRYHPLKSKAYFAFKHGAPAHGYVEALKEVLKYAEWHRQDAKSSIEWCIQNGYPIPEITEEIEDVINRAIGEGMARALSARRAYLSRDTIEKYASSFKRFSRQRIASDRMNVCLFTRHFPPDPVDGIGRCLHELSLALASFGHTVHVLTTSDTYNRVDLEDGVWVHRLTVKYHPRPFPDIPQDLWNYSRTLMEEVERIHQLDRVDMIKAPSWDCEGIAALLDSDIPVVTSLHTPLLIAASMHPNWMIDREQMEERIVPILTWERRLMLFSDGLAANTNAIIETIEREYELALDRSRILIVGHAFHDRVRGSFGCRAKTNPVGSEYHPITVRSARARDAELRLLFLGRLEYRKGIDVLLKALQRLLPEFPQLQVDIVGENIHESEKSFEDQFRECAAGAVWVSQVTFHGRVEQELLDDYLEACDIFVAPSRFESFGLIFLEAMMHGKPCVGTDVGGIPEVVVDGETGLLVKPGDPDELADALRRLVLSGELRSKLGEAARRHYVDRFTPRAWAERCLELYKSVRAAGSVVRRVETLSNGPVELSRHCELSEFWVTGPLYRLLSKIGGCAIDWRVWAFSLVIEALTQKAPQREAVEGRALIIADHHFPDIAPHVTGWVLRSMLLSPPEQNSCPFAELLARRLTRLRYRRGEFDLVNCLAVLDPLDGAFEAIVTEIARVCRPGGTVYVLVAVGDMVRRQAVRIGEILEQAGLQAKVNLVSFFHREMPGVRFCEEHVEPYLGISIAGEGRPLATVELERLATCYGMNTRGHTSKVAAR